MKSPLRAISLPSSICGLGILCGLSCFLAATPAGAQSTIATPPPIGHAVVSTPHPASTSHRTPGQSVFGTKNPRPDSGPDTTQQYSATLTVEIAISDTKKTFGIHGAAKFNQLPPGGYKIICTFLEKNPAYDSTKPGSQPYRITKTFEKSAREAAADYSFSIPFAPGPALPPNPTDDTGSGEPPPVDWMVIVQAGGHIVAAQASSQQALDQFIKPPPAPGK